MNWRAGQASPSVLFVSHSVETGGAELALLDLVRGRAGSQVLLFGDGPFRAKLAEAGVAVETLSAGSVLELRRQSGLAAAARGIPSLLRVALGIARQARHHDLIYANSMKGFVAAALAAPIARRPLVWHLHDILGEETFGIAMRRTVIWLANRFATSIIANSRATAQAFAAQGGTAPVVVIHNGINSSAFIDQGNDDAREKLAAEFSIGDGCLIGLFGRLAPWKGQHVAIEAMREVPDHHLLIVGGPLFGEEDYERRLRAQVEKADLAGRVHFLGSRNDVPTLMRGVDIVAHTSTSPEPFGRVIVEGMMAGKPVIATAAGGALEIITHGLTGLLTPPGDVAALREAILVLLRDPQQARELGERGKAHAMRTFALGASSEAVEEAIESAAQ